MANARNDCWQPCPRGDSDCCSGLKCYDTSQGESGGTCTNSDYTGSNHYYCGSSWCSAAYSCTNACPGGTNDECPRGQLCYADVPCTGGSQPPDVTTPSSQFNKYCGKDGEPQTCWYPCRDDGDCCSGLKCRENVTECPYPDNVGADHFFCGSGESCFLVKRIFDMFY